MLTKEQRTELAEKLNGVSADDKDKLIYRTRFGLDDGNYRSLEDTGKIFKISGEAVRLIVTKIDRLIET